MTQSVASLQTVAALSPQHQQQQQQQGELCVQRRQMHVQVDEATTAAAASADASRRRWLGAWTLRPRRAREVTATGGAATASSSAATTAAAATTPSSVAHVCATFMTLYRQCLDVNPDAKVNCTYALDNYIKCQQQQYSEDADGDD